MDNMKDLMVDLESLGTGSKSVILAIGAVEFGPEGLGRRFYTNIEPQSCVDAGLTIDVSTIMWWMKQSDEARAVFSRGACPSLGTALVDFTEFCMGKGYSIWGNGAAFDNVLLANAYKAVGRQPPWQHYNDRCYRTLKHLYPAVPTPPVSGIAHNALDDAVWQAQHAVAILKQLKGDAS